MDLCPCELRPLWKNASDLGMPFERDVSLDLFVAVVSCSGWWMSEAAGGEVSLSLLSLLLDVDERGNLTPAKQSTGKQ